MRPRTITRRSTFPGKGNKVTIIALAVFALLGFQWSLAPTLGMGQTAEEIQDMKKQLQKDQTEREAMKQRLEQLEKATGVPPPIPETAFRVNIRRPEELRLYNPVNCPGFMECEPEPQLQLESPKPAKGPGWEIELQAYNRFRFNYYDNFSDTRNAAGSSATTAAFVNTPSCSFNTSCKDDNRLRFSTMRGYFTWALKNGPFQAVMSMDYAGDQFNDGSILGNDSGTLGAAGQRQWVTNLQLYYLEYNGWARVRLGRQYNHVGNGIVGHIPRDSITAFRSWTDLFSTQITYVYGSTGRSIPNQAGPVLFPNSTTTGQFSETTQNKVNDATGHEENLEGFMVIFNYNPKPMNRLQAFVWRMWDTTNAGFQKQNQYIDINGSGRIGRFDYAFEAVHNRGTTPQISSGVVAQSAGQLPASSTNTREKIRSYLGYLDVRYWLPPDVLRTQKQDLLALGMTFGYGTGDNKPTDGVNKNFDQLFIDETVFRYNFMFSDDIHGYDGRSFDSRRGSGFSNVTFFQPYMVVKPTEKLQTKVAWTYLRATLSQPAGTGVLGPAPVLGGSALTYNCGQALTAANAVTCTGLGQRTKDIGQEFDVLTDYYFNPQTRLFSYFGMFFPGRIYAPFADNAIKYEMGVEFRF